jgi:hypothetical protein
MAARSALGFVREGKPAPHPATRNRGSDREAVHFGHRGTPPRFSAIERHAARRLFTKDVFRGESEFRNAPSRPPTRGQQPVTDRQMSKVIDPARENLPTAVAKA